MNFPLTLCFLSRGFSSKKTLKFIEVGPAIQFKSIRRNDQLFELKRIKFTDLESVPPKTSVVVKPRDRPTAFEQMQKRVTSLEVDNITTKKLLAKLTASSLLSHIVQNIKYFENGLVNFWFPEIRDKHMNFGKLGKIVEKRPDLANRYQEFKITKSFTAINAIITSPFFTDMKDGRDLASHPAFKFDNFSAEMDLFQSLDFKDITGEFKDIAIILNIMPLYNEFLKALSEHPKEFKFVPESEPENPNNK